MVRSPAPTAALAAAFAFAGVFALAPAASAETDFMTAAKIACTPDSVTRCESAGKCTTRPASARDKTELLVLDFAGKKASIRKGATAKTFGDVVEDQVDGEERRILVAEPGKGGRGEKLAMRLSKGGKLSLDIGGGNKAEATCAAES